jgi:hypothetical protein
VENVAHLRAIGRLCQQAGLRVVEAGGWTTRGRDWAVLRPEYVVVHHTAAPVDVDRLLIEGRPGVPGPLCNLALHADGTVVLIASGTANHAGVATISSAQAWGIEATGPIPTGNTGVDAFPNYDAYLTLCAAIRVHHGWPAGRVVAHKEIARPDGRKIDPAFGSPFPAPYPDMARFRTQVDQRVQTWGQETDMPLDQNDKDAIRSIVAQELDRFRGERPANLSSDPANKPLTMGESLGAFAGGIPKIDRNVAKLLEEGSPVTLTPDQLTALAEALAPLVAAHLEIAGHPTMVGTVQLAAAEEPPA